MNRLNSNLIHRKRSPFPNREGLSGGFTVVELVVALAIILIVSATAIGLVNSQNTIYLRTMQTTEATNMAENAIECFRFAKGDTAVFNTVYGKTFEGTDIALNESTDGETGKTVYTLESNGMEVTIEIDGNTLNFKAYDGSKEILSRSYTR